MSIQVPIINARVPYINGLGLTRTGNTTVTVASGAASDSTNVNDITLGALVTFTGTTVGVNGVDVAAIIASTFYAVYLIGDSTGYKTTACLASLSFTTPSLPFGYDMYRRIGSILTDGSSHVLQFWQIAGSGGSRRMYYDVGISVLSGGTSTTYANVDLSAAVPQNATTEVLFDIAFTANAATDIAQFLIYGSSATNGFVRYGTGVAAAQVGQIIVPCAPNTAKPEIQYKVTSGSDSLTLLVTGYNDYL